MAEDQASYSQPVNIPGVGLVQFPTSMSDDEIATAAKKLFEASQPKPEQPKLGSDVSVMGITPDMGLGAVKGAAHTALDLGSLVSKIPYVSGGIDSMWDRVYPNTKITSQQAFDQTRKDTAYSNNEQRIGGALETALEGTALGGLSAGNKSKIVTLPYGGGAVTWDVGGPTTVASRLKDVADKVPAIASDYAAGLKEELFSGPPLTAKRIGALSAKWGTKAVEGAIITGLGYQALAKLKQAGVLKALFGSE